MRAVVVAVGLLLSALVLAPPGVEAQSDGSERFYVTDVNVGSGDPCSDGDNEYEGSNEAPAEGKAYGGTSGVGVACGFIVTYTTTEDYQLSGDVAIEFWSNCEAGATIEQDYSLFIGDTTIAEVRGGSIGPCAATETPIQGGGTHSSGDLFVPAGTDVRMRFALFSGPEPGAGPVRNAYITVGGSMPSGFAVDGWGIPFEAPAPQAATVFEDLASPTYNASFENATSDTVVLNFTSDLENATAAFSWNATEGSVNATLFDGNGTEVFADSFTGQGAWNETLTSVIPGDWNLTLRYDGFNGTFAFFLADPGPVPGEGNMTLDGNATLDAAGQESPGLPLLVGAVVLFAVASRRRR